MQQCNTYIRDFSLQLKDILLLSCVTKFMLFSLLLFIQVANVFQSLTDDSMHPCIVHRDSRLQISHKYPIVLATPSTLFTYSLKILNNVQVVVTDEADLVIASGGDDIWEILSFFKGVDSLKKRRKQQKRLARQKALQERSETTKQWCDSSIPITVNEIRTKGLNHSGENVSIQANISPSQRQFVFVAATLPSRGKKAVYNVLKGWLPDAAFVSTDLVHHTVPTVDIFYVKVEEALKLPELLSCLNSFVGIIKYPLTGIRKRSGDQEMVGNAGNVGASTHGSSDRVENAEMFLAKEKLDISAAEKGHFVDGTCESRKETFLEPVALKNLRVLVFVNTPKAAERSFNFLSDITEEGAGDSIPWEHASQHEKIITTWKTVQDGAAAHEYVVTHTGLKDVWLGRVGRIHGDIPSSERIETLRKFSSGELRVLICTDLASRGLDIPDVSHVIQLDFASNAAQVLHRTGRTARAGASGKGTYCKKLRFKCL